MLIFVSPASLTTPWCRTICGRIGRNSTTKKHKTTGYNLQITTDQSGNIVFISKQYVSNMHDLTALRDTGVLDVLALEHLTVDKGYIWGLAAIRHIKQSGQKQLEGR